MTSVCVCVCVCVPKPLVCSENTEEKAGAVGPLSVRVFDGYLNRGVKYLSYAWNVQLGFVMAFLVFLPALNT